MLIKIIKCYISVLFFMSVSAKSDDKSSLSFVIDSTRSMADEIDQVKREANNIFDTVMNSEKSQIENFILVIFRDPGVHLLTVTKDREEFKKQLASIELIGNWDCPELSMGGITKALQASLPGSMLYVFTDAAAKDAYLYEDVKSLALSKGAQVIFLLTGVCPPDDDGNSQVYYDLAETTNGEVFDLSKNDIKKILKYVEENTKGRKTNFFKQSFPPGKHSFNYTVDSNMKELVISIKGKDPVFDLYDPDGNEAQTEEFVRTGNTAILRVLEVKTGVYKAEISSSTKTKVDITGEDTMHFKIGFSTHQPSCIEETAPSPLPDELSFISIKLESDGLVELQSVQLVDMDQNIIAHSVLELINNKDRFYITKPLVSPNKSFRVAVNGYDYSSKSSVTRVGLIPLESQNLTKVDIIEKAPIITSIGKSEFYADYEKPLDIKCRVRGYPKPDVTWEDNDGVITSFEVSIVEIPYDYITIHSIDVVTTNKTYKCSASNKLGEDSKTITVKTIRTNYFDIIEMPQDTNIIYGGSSKIYCKIDADPPASIKWYREKKRIHKGDHYHISEDGSELTIKAMDPVIAGMFACRAKNNKYRKRFRFHVSIHGVAKPVIDRTITEIRVKMGSTARINCRILEGTPKPEITWYFKSIQGATGRKISGNHETLVIKNVHLEHYGTYRCKAKNVLGEDYYYNDLIVEYAPVMSNVTKKRMIAQNGEIVTLPCKVYGEPQPDVQWFFNGSKIDVDSSVFYMHQKGLRFKAIIKYIGEFICEATNKHGIARSSPIYVNVIVPVTIDPPQISNMEVNVGESVQLDCNANGVPTPAIKWIFQNINLNPPFKVIRNPQSSLRLQYIQVDQEGNYTCIASNTGSASNITYQVKVLAPVTIAQGLNEVFTGVVGDLVVRVPCRAIGSPKPDITWSVDGFNVPTGSKSFDIGTDGTLSIKNISNYSAGAYTCHASNKLGVANRVFDVQIFDSPLPGDPTKTLSFGEGSSTKVPCGIKHDLSDTIRWYKDKKLIADGELLLTNVTLSDAGLYTCRVSTIRSSKSSHVHINVGSEPKFVNDVVNNKILFREGVTVELNCIVYGEPMPEVTWWHNKKQIKHYTMTYDVTMALNNRGKYFCLAKNTFGTKFKSFEILTEECRLDVETDFGLNQPLILLPDLSLPSYDLIDGYARIPSNQKLILQCPDQFKNIKDTIVDCKCEKDKKFIIDGESIEYDDLKCRDEFEPTTVKSETSCFRGYTEMINVGYELDDGYLNVYDICLDLNKNVPIYAKYFIDKSAADIDVKNKKWFNSNLLEFDFDVLYDCKHQTKELSSILHRDFHKNDTCCFSKRQLVPSRDMSPGLPQIATYSTLNIIPQWSTCNMKNWDSIERRIRKLATSFDNPLLVYTGTSEELKMKTSGYKLGIRLTDQYQEGYQSVPLYLWKVVQNPVTKSSLAIIQVNVPDLKLSNAYQQYFKCKDICNQVVWMYSDRWRDVTRGYTYCCNLKDFETAFGIEGVFQNMYDVFTDI